MEEQNNNLQTDQDDLFEREEQCQKAIRTVAKAIFMRFVILLLMAWVVISNPTQIWAWGVAVLVLLINLMGCFPLIQEYRKQKSKLRELIDMEE